MLKNKILMLKISLFAVVLPFIYGCQAGGGGSVSGLVGGGTAGSSFTGDGTGGGLTLSAGISGGSEVIHNPEPASMLLLGGGMMAMALWKRKNSKRSI